MNVLHIYLYFEVKISRIIPKVIERLVYSELRVNNLSISFNLSMIKFTH